jgi:hypothetical protein
LIAAESTPYMVVGSKNLIVGNTYTLVASTDFSDYPFYLYLIGGPVVGSNFHFPRPESAPLVSGSGSLLLY